MAALIEDTPRGPVLEDAGPAGLPERGRTVAGRTVALVPTEPSHAAGLYARLCGADRTAVFAYMFAGPFVGDEAGFARHVEAISRSRDPFYYTVVTVAAAEEGQEEAAGTPLGYLSLCAIEPAHRSVEVGHITFGPRLQRTTAATEALALAMRLSLLPPAEAVEGAGGGLGYRRLEWKCDALNAKSRRAAERLGFGFEGVFRKHRIVRGRSRDTAWYAVTEDEAGLVLGALEAWLDPANFDAGGAQVRTLEQVRRDLSSGGGVVGK